MRILINNGKYVVYDSENRPIASFKTSPEAILFARNFNIIEEYLEEEKDIFSL